IPEKYRPLPKRTNVIMTRQTDFKAPGAHVVHGLDEALQLARENGENEVFIIGGGEIYSLGLEKADILYLTEIQASFEGDAFFPEFDRDNWEEVSRVHHPSDARHKYEFDFVIYHRKHENR
ncbi:MAG: dihydrofolate reductase, partial [Cyclobacteriaceae bacterium]